MNAMKDKEKQTNQPMSRRGFVRGAAGALMAATVFPAIMAGSARGKDGAVAPGNRITLGVIGCGPQGLGDLQNFLAQADCQVVAVCDLKNDQLAQACAAVNNQYGNKDCRTYHDFRDLLQRKDIDACLIATPDHWHVPVALAAVNSGKDIYLEKPLALSLEDSQALRSRLRKKQRVFQFGTQQRSNRLFRFASELVRNGAIGDLKHINVWAPGSAPGGSRELVPPPPGLDYDFWLGPTPFVPHTLDRCTADNFRKTWWFISDYTLGFITGWGIHPMDIAMWGGGAGLGQTVTAEGRANFRLADGVCDTATIWEIDYTFSNGVTLKFVGAPNGGNRDGATGDPFLHAEEWGQRYRKICTHGTAFEGSSGWVKIDRYGIQLQPEDLIDQAEDSFKTKLTRSSHHARNFLDCVKSREETVCPIEAAIAVDTMCHIGEAAIRLGRKVTFDFNKEHFINDSEANHRLKSRPPRKLWTL
jgi:predicted dehydrogenase